MTSAKRSIVVLLCLACCRLALADAMTNPAEAPGRLRARAILDEATIQFKQDRDTAKARTQLKVAAAEDPSYATPHYHLGLLALGKKDWDCAIAEFHQFTTLDPSSPLTL